LEIAVKVFLLRFFAAVFVSFLIVSPAMADYEAGKEALNREDYATALSEFRPLAEQGDAEGQYGMGLMYGPGNGVPKNEVLAVEWFIKAANQGHTASMVQLGVYYDNGFGVVEDDGIALAWFQKAADLGDGDAMYSLGRMHYYGYGTPKDNIEAYKWMLIGAMLKNARSRASMDVLAAEMTNAEVAKSVERAQAFVDAFEIRRVAAEKEKERKAAEVANKPAPANSAATSAAASGTTLEDKLRKLKELEEAGLITKEEAAEKRKELLADL
jgi:hypothetical protein